MASEVWNLTVSEEGVFNPRGKQFGSIAKQVEKSDLISSKSATTWAIWETAFQPNAGRHRSRSHQDWQKETTEDMG